MREKLYCHGCNKVLSPYKKKWCSGVCQDGVRYRTRHKIETQKNMSDYWNRRLQSGNINFTTFVKEINLLK